MGQTKVAEQVHTLLKTSAVALRSVTQERDELQVKVDGFEKSAKATVIVEKMVERGLIEPAASQEKVAELVEKDNLDVIEEAVNLSTSDELAKIAAVGESDQPGAGRDVLEQFLLSD